MTASSGSSWAGAGRLVDIIDKCSRNGCKSGYWPSRGHADDLCLCERMKQRSEYRSTYSLRSDTRNAWYLELGLWCTTVGSADAPLFEACIGARAGMAADMSFVAGIAATPFLRSLFNKSTSSFGLTTKPAHGGFYQRSRR
jgi:hypothetical protein